MNANRAKQIAANARLNYLVDMGLSADEIYKEIEQHRLSLKFIENIVIKRNREKNNERTSRSNGFLRGANNG